MPRRKTTRNDVEAVEVVDDGTKVIADLPQVAPDDGSVVPTISSDRAEEVKPASTVPKVSTESSSPELSEDSPSKAKTTRTRKKRSDAGTGRRTTEGAARLAKSPIEVDLPETKVYNPPKRRAFSHIMRNR